MKIGNAEEMIVSHHGFVEDEGRFDVLGDFAHVAFEPLVAGFWLLSLAVVAAA